MDMYKINVLDDSLLCNCHEQCATQTVGVPTLAPGLLMQSLWTQGGHVSLVLPSPQFVFNGAVLWMNDGGHPSVSGSRCLELRIRHLQTRWHLLPLVFFCWQLLGDSTKGKGISGDSILKGFWLHASFKAGRDSLTQSFACQCKWQVPHCILWLCLTFLELL